MAVNSNFALNHDALVFKWLSINSYPGQLLTEYFSPFRFNNELCRQTIRSLHNMVGYMILPLTKGEKIIRFYNLLFQEMNLSALDTYSVWLFFSAYNFSITATLATLTYLTLEHYLQVFPHLQLLHAYNFNTLTTLLCVLTAFTRLRLLFPARTWLFLRS